jgi:hypothetical protein
MQNRLDPDEFEDALKERDKVRNTFVDLTINQDDYTN